MPFVRRYAAASVFVTPSKRQEEPSRFSCPVATLCLTTLRLTTAGAWSCLKTRVALLILCLCLAAGSAEAQSYAFQTVDVPNAGPRGTTATAVNDAGTVVGYYDDVNDSGGNATHGFIRQSVSSPVTVIDYPGAIGTRLTGVNNAGQVVGVYLDVNFQSHGFMWSGGQFTKIEPAGAQSSLAQGINNMGQIVVVLGGTAQFTQTLIWTAGVFTTITTSNFSGVGINDAGEVAGTYFTCPPSGGTCQEFLGLFSGGLLSHFSYPGSAQTQGTGINNAGQVVGYTGTSGFLFSAGTFRQIAPPGSTFAEALGISNRGEIAGQNFPHGFVTFDPLLDPVPNALNGPNVVSDAAPPNAHGWSGADLLLFGNSVQGIAADGVSQVAIAIPAASVGDQFTVTLFNDQSPPAQGSSNEDGALGRPGDTTFSANQVTVTARATRSYGPTAFAEYRAPVDFARPLGQGTFKAGACNGTANTDNQLACRYVTVVIQNLQTNTNYSLTIQIVRPPVLLVHGLWSNPQAWSNFLVTSNGSDDPRFSRRTIDWSGSLTGGDQVTATAPSHGSIQMGRIKGNSLGIEFNSPKVQQQISEILGEFKSGNNPISAPVAAVQSDIVAHSMGGDLTLGMRLGSSGQAAGYQRNDNLGQGDVHKLITVDTPYLGSPLATQLLQGYLGTGPSNDCVRGFLDLAGNFSLASVGFAAGPNRPGAIYDLQGDGLGSGMSFALEGVTDPVLTAPLHIPTALIAATMNAANLAPIDSSPLAGIIHKFCGTLAISPNPIALNLTSSGWPNVFNGAASDAIVPFTSEVNAKNGNISANILSGSLFTGVHGGGLNLLGFAPPTVLDAGAAPSQVVTLLNTPVTDPTAYNIF